MTQALHFHAYKAIEIILKRAAYAGRPFGVGTLTRAAEGNTITSEKIKLSGAGEEEAVRKDDYLGFCAALPGAALDQPFVRERSGFIAVTYIARHQATKKWFAAIMERDGSAFVNLKCEPMEANLLRQAYKGIQPGYHMNKEHWNSVYLCSDVPEELIRQLTMESYHLTWGTRSGKAPEKQRTQ